MSDRSRRDFGDVYGLATPGRAGGKWSRTAIILDVEVPLHCLNILMIYPGNTARVAGRAADTALATGRIARTIDAM
jgi:hypothetical protein